MKKSFVHCSVMILAFFIIGSWQALGQTPFCTGFGGNQECRDWCNDQGLRDFLWIQNCLEGCENCLWECQDDMDCPGNDRCLNTQCVECFRDSHCGPDEVCRSKVCEMAECMDDSDCGPGQICDGGACQDLETPVVISIHDDWFRMTSWRKGVFFDIDADGRPERTAWTTVGSDDAFLVLDRNGNGEIDDAGELFGNRTEQEPSHAPNGFKALARLDASDRGGNLDGHLTSEDRTFHKLQLWFDTNQNGRADRGELQPLALFVVAIDLDYRTFQHVDQHGNRYPFKTKVVRRDGSVRIACDVVFVVEQTAKNPRGRLPLRRD